jgi:hypothetical protein
MSAYPLEGLSNYTITFNVVGENLEYRIDFASGTEFESARQVIVLLNGWSGSTNAYLTSSSSAFRCFSPNVDVNTTGSNCVNGPRIVNGTKITIQVVNNKTITFTNSVGNIGTINFDISASRYILIPNAHSNFLITDNEPAPPTPPPEEAPLLPIWAWILIGLGILVILIIIIIVILLLVKKKK